MYRAVWDESKANFTAVGCSAFVLAADVEAAIAKVKKHAKGYRVKIRAMDRFSKEWPRDDERFIV